MLENGDTCAFWPPELGSNADKSNGNFYRNRQFLYGRSLRNYTSNFLGIQRNKLDGMLVTNTICVVFVDCKILNIVIFICSGQIIYLALVVVYVFPSSTTRVTCIVDSSYWKSLFSFTICPILDLFALTLYIGSRADSRLAPNQWETSLQSNAVSYWLGTSLESALYSVHP